MNIWLVLVAMFLVGVAEVFADTHHQHPDADAGRQARPGDRERTDHGRLLTANQLVGPAIGALLFAAGMAWPFLIQTICVGLGVVLISKIATPKGAVRESVDTHVRQDIVEGVRWIARNRPVRTLALVIVAFNVTWAAPWSVLVLWTLQVVGIDEAGFGLLTTASALGGLLGTFGYGRIEKHVPLATLMRRCCWRGGLPPGDGVHHVGVRAFPLMFFFGAYAFVWGTLSSPSGSARCPPSSRVASGRST